MRVRSRSPVNSQSDRRVVATKMITMDSGLDQGAASAGIRRYAGKGSIPGCGTRAIDQQLNAHIALLFWFG